MSNRAKVSSVEAIEAFRNNLIIYLSKARPAVEEINSDVVRTRMWVENDQRVRWEHEMRRRKNNLEDAQNAFFSAQMSHLRQPTVAERMAVTKAKAALEEAEVKLRVIKRWNRDLSSQLEPLARQLEHLHTVLSGEVPQAIAHLSKVVTTLQEYSGVTASLREGTAGDPVAPSEQSVGEEKDTNEPE